MCLIDLGRKVLVTVKISRSRLGDCRSQQGIVESIGREKWKSYIHKLSREERWSKMEKLAIYFLKRYFRDDSDIFVDISEGVKQE